jgi:hypothetical protein
VRNELQQALIAVNPWPVNIYNQTTGSGSSIGDNINLKIAGVRTATTSTTSGAQSGDTLNTHTGWIDSNINNAVGTFDILPQIVPFTYDTLTASTPTHCAVYTVELVTTR